MTNAAPAGTTTHEARSVQGPRHRRPHSLSAGRRRKRLPPELRQKNFQSSIEFKLKMQI